jgi:hypothetical protein
MLIVVFRGNFQEIEKFELNSFNNTLKNISYINSSLTLNIIVSYSLNLWKLLTKKNQFGKKNGTLSPTDSLECSQ